MLSGFISIICYFSWFLIPLSCPLAWEGESVQVTRPSQIHDVEKQTLLFDVQSSSHIAKEKCQERYIYLHFDRLTPNSWNE